MLIEVRVQLDGTIKDDLDRVSHHHAQYFAQDVGTLRLVGPRRHQPDDVLAEFHRRRPARCARSETQEITGGYYATTP